MYSIKALAVVAIFGLARSTLALPQNFSAVVAAVPADSIDKYTVKFFLDNVKTSPPPSSCVFYTKGLSTKAQDFAVRQVKFTIWNAWDCSLYDRDQVDTNPLRDILKETGTGINSPDTQTYFENMSEAYAALCDVTATLLTIDPKNVDLSGIWGQTEFPRLQQTGNPGGQVDTIEGCDEDASNCIDPPFWTRPVTKKFRRGTSISPTGLDEADLEKRQVGNCPDCDPLPTQCFTPEELGRIFSDVDKAW